MLLHYDCPWLTPVPPPAGTEQCRGEMSRCRSSNSWCWRNMTEQRLLYLCFPWQSREKTASVKATAQAGAREDPPPHGSARGEGGGSGQQSSTATELVTQEIDKLQLPVGPRPSDPLSSSESQTGSWDRSTPLDRRTDRQRAGTYRNVVCGFLSIFTEQNEKLSF